jgi:glycosyltransferase involved in cell wall biosynthesis
LRIAHLMGHMGLNGVATSTQMLVNQQAKAGHDVLLVYPEDSWLSEQKLDARVQLLKSSFKAEPYELRRIGDALRSWKCDVVHSHGSRGNKFAMVFRIAAGAPTVMTAHARKFQLPWLAAHILIALSQDTASFYTRLGLVRAKSVRVIPNMFALDGIVPPTEAEKAKAKAAIGLVMNKFVFGSVGIIGERKNQIAMLRLLRDVRKRGIDASLVLVGIRDPERSHDAFNRLAADPEIAPHVHELGQRTDVPEIIPALDVFLVMSKIEEAPVAPLEAMSREIPVISFDVGNMAEITSPELLVAQGDEAGFLAAAERLARDRAVRKTAGEVARETIRLRLAPAIVLQKIEAAYRDAINRTPKFKQRQADADGTTGKSTG